MSRTPPRSLGPGEVLADELKDIREEIALYLELRTEELVRGGMDPEEARGLAEERFGDRARIEDELWKRARRRRARKGTTMTMNGVGQDVRYASRMLVRSPGFAVVAVLTLALGLGGNTAIFSVVDAALLQALPFEDHERLVFVNGYHLANGEIAIRGASYPEFRDWAEGSSGVRPMAAVDQSTLAMTGEGEAQSLSTEIVTEGYFAVLGVEPVLGRALTADDHGADGAVAVVSHALWERVYGAAPDVLGRSLVLNDRTFTVVGVMPPGFAGISLAADLWLPETASIVLGFGGVLEQRGSRFLSVVGRLTTSQEAAQRELDAVATALQGEHPEAHEDRFAQVQPFRDAYLDGTGTLLWILLGAGGLLLLIATANVANLLLVRSHARTREMVLRRALGAENGRIAGQLLAESMVLALPSLVLGLVMAGLGLRALAPSLPQGVLPGYVDIGLSWSAFGYSLAVVLLVAAVMGLVPAASSARVDIAPALREGGRGAAGSLRRFRTQHAFVVAQVSLALVLMVGAGLLTRSFRAQLGIDTGSSLDQVVAMRMSLPGARYPDADARRRIAADLERLAAEIPGVRSVSLSSDLPFRGGSSGAYVYRADRPDDEIRFHRHSVTPGYLETLGIELAAGRFLSEDDVEAAPGVGVITEAMARRVFPDENPIGRTLYLQSGRRMGFEVVGVIGDVRYRDLRTSLMADANSPDVFFAYDQIPSGTIEVAIEVDGDPASYTQALRDVAMRADPDLPIFDLAPLSEGYRLQTATPRFAASLMGLFGTLALVLACVGIYGVLAFTVGQRAQEIAIRRAIGAGALSVGARVVGDGLRLTAVGFVVGGAAAMAGSRVLQSLLFEVSSNDPVTFAVVLAVMAGVAVAAGLVPAVRAMRRDPAAALTAE